MSHWGEIPVTQFWPEQFAQLWPNLTDNYTYVFVYGISVYLAESLVNRFVELYSLLGRHQPVSDYRELKSASYLVYCNIYCLHRGLGHWFHRLYAV